MLNFLSVPPPKKMIKSLFLLVLVSLILIIYLCLVIEKDKKIIINILIFV